MVGPGGRVCAGGSPQQAREQRVPCPPPSAETQNHSLLARISRVKVALWFGAWLRKRLLNQLCQMNTQEGPEGQRNQWGRVPVLPRSRSHNGAASEAAAPS